MSAKIALSIGCPSGVGPEVSVAAAADARARVLLVGDIGAVDAAARATKIDPARIEAVARPEDAWRLPRGAIAVWQPTPPLAAKDRRPGSSSPRGGAAQLAWIDAACDLVSRGMADALVTGPVSKEAIVRSRAPGASTFIGHTEHLQRRLRAREVVMTFWSRELTTALVTTHLALKDVPRAITSAAVARATYWLARLLADLAPRSRVPRIAVAGLNPHAGESGLFGREEITRISPAIVKARARLARDGARAEIVGPVPAESAFRLAHGGVYDGVVAMYHDQATIPMKLVGFGEAVNVSLGLPIVRTSVDHGTAYDRAGKGIANARGMREAIALATRLVSAAGGRSGSRRTSSPRSR